jgi:DNA-binding transcriptional regulator YiaG
MEELTPKRIRRIREKLGLTQEQFAQTIGVSFATVNRWERGHTKPSSLARKCLVGLEKV